MSADNTYDLLPYPTSPRRATHPDTVATVARLMGLNPAPVRSCRVLELGCGTGGNLTPMAATLPNSQFVGIDYSPVQIDQARALVNGLGLTNIEYRAESFLDVADDLGTFDYIIAHGVYSWVPSHVRDKMVALCSKLLSPNGLVYISYNTYPGWHFRAPFREMMNYYVRDIPIPQEQATAARGFLNFLAKIVPDKVHPYAEVVRDEAERISRNTDAYLYHEHLEADNAPVYFHQFMAHVSQHGLQFVGEVEERRRQHELDPEMRKQLEQSASTIVELEQMYDFVWNRTFRKTVLCHEGLTIPRRPTAEILLSLHASAAVRPNTESISLDPDHVVEFVNPDGVTMSTNSPFVKAMLWELHRYWPGHMPIPVLIERVAESLGSRWKEDPARGEKVLYQTLLEFFLSGLIDLSTNPVDFVIDAGERPVGLPLARRFARQSEVLPNARHQLSPVSPFDRFVLTHLDGSRSRAELATLLKEAIASGQIESPDGEGDPLLASLHRLGRSALLVA